MGEKAMNGLLPILLISACAVYLVLHEKYEDGLIGRIALAGIVLAATMVTITYFGGYAQYSFSSEMVLLLWSVCAFLMRHVYRFWRFSTGGKFSWRHE